jgi:hypothetical protein
MPRTIVGSLRNYFEENLTRSDSIIGQYKGFSGARWPKTFRKTFARNLQAGQKLYPTALAARSGRTGLAFLHGVGSRLKKGSPPPARSDIPRHGASETKTYKTGKLSSMSNRLFHRPSIYCLTPHRYLYDTALLGGRIQLSSPLRSAPLKVCHGKSKPTIRIDAPPQTAS